LYTINIILCHFSYVYDLVLRRENKSSLGVQLNNSSPLEVLYVLGIFQLAQVTIIYDIRITQAVTA